jgi:hypothetical protein
MKDPVSEARVAQFAILKRAGEAGRVAVNPALVTEVRSSSGPFIDIHFGDHRVAVEGSLQQVIAKLSRPEQPAVEPTPAAESWLSTHPHGTHR